MAEPIRQDETRRSVERLTGFAVYATTVSGLAGILFGFIAVLSGNWAASGPFFIAAALAFGLLANAILRD